ncbi:fimbrial protein [Caballeronia sp. LZ065]|uniref:fimbrial protein n=1 Tax=Caballeronia sp. LZ065 TaxID=3038571 RepID=UPI002855B341|nr:fimbrial protein [Caballeronia sp. LZ065]MDR5778892.1 fimbrial protein [Caballeronia sp. LZ065]
MKKNVLALVALLAGAACGAAHASGGTLTINGQLTASTCQVSGNGGTGDFTVTLPTIAASDFAEAGRSGGNTPFNLALTNCTPDTGNVHAFWESGANTLPNGNLKNTGTASNVEVQLVDVNNGLKVIDVSKTDGAQNAQDVAIAGGRATLRYAAQYTTPTGGATAGTVSTVVTYSMSYQ